MSTDRAHARLVGLYTHFDSAAFQTSGFHQRLSTEMATCGIKNYLVSKWNRGNVKIVIFYNGEAYESDVERAVKNWCSGYDYIFEAYHCSRETMFNYCVDFHSCKSTFFVRS